MYLSILIVFSTLFLLSGCTKTVKVPKPPSPMTESYLNSHIGVRYDKKLQQTKVQALTYTHNGHNQSHPSLSVTLVGDTYDTNSAYALKFDSDTAYYLWITFTAAQWGEFERTISVSGESLPIERHQSKIQNGIYIEAYSISLSRLELQKRQESGFDLLLLGKEQTTSVILPPLYLSTFLTRFDQIKKERRRPLRREDTR